MRQLPKVVKKGVLGVEKQKIGQGEVAALKIFLFPACWKGMRYAQKFFRINFKFYKLVFLVAALKIFQKSY